MIDYTEAVRLAKERKPEVDYCAEYANGYIFSCPEGRESEGGPAAAFAIIKEDGRVVNARYFNFQYDHGELIAEHDLQ